MVQTSRIGDALPLCPPYPWAPGSHLQARRHESALQGMSALGKPFVAVIGPVLAGMRLIRLPILDSQREHPRGIGKGRLLTRSRPPRAAALGLPARIQSKARLVGRYTKVRAAVFISTRPEFGMTEVQSAAARTERSSQRNWLYTRLSDSSRSCHHQRVRPRSA